jgi:hypothetical protein
MATSTNAKPAPKKMLENTVKRTLKKLEPTTESGAKTKIAFKPALKLRGRGAKKTNAGRKRTVLLLGPSDLGSSFDSLANNVASYPLWGTTMTMTSLSLYAGYAKPAISTITSNSPF